jgi:hypothetical protein
MIVENPRIMTEKEPFAMSLKVEEFLSCRAFMSARFGV